jgi:hypothetical protein
MASSRKDLPESRAHRFQGDARIPAKRAAASALSQRAPKRGKR